MKVYKRVKNLRENKKISQDSVAYELNLNQSQYSRRENGEIPFSAEEIEKLASVMDTKISELYGEETIIFNNHNQKGGAFGQIENYVTVPDKLIEQYEKRIEEKETIISLLKEQINTLKKANL
ncbi:MULTISPECIES: helix-turn-helix domain-containing protein [Bacteroidota]|uniref:helix-turn-helix domain-containing protein n=1 Tax=Bacteroidota TaxID=976 RepID=UPI00241C8520|nr:MULTISPECIES: helix-turn-helix transcriptional regulator [Bacteroidota]